MQKWEYTLAYGNIIRTKGRTITNSDISLLWAKQPDSNNEPIWETVKKWGDEGWELVNVFPVARFHMGNNAGYTSEVVFVFKRPKE